MKNKIYFWFSSILLCFYITDYVHGTEFEKLEISMHTNYVFQLYVKLFEYLKNVNDVDDIIYLKIKEIINDVFKEVIPDEMIFQRFHKKIVTRIFINSKSLLIDKNSKTLTALRALEITKAITVMHQFFPQIIKNEINKITEFQFAELSSYEMENVKNLLLYFIIASNKVFQEKEKEKLTNAINNILKEYNNRDKIKGNFGIILDKIYNDTDIRRIKIMNNIKYDLMINLKGNTLSLEASRLIIENNILQNLPNEYPSNKIVLLENAIFHILLKHNFDCNNFNETNLINDIINQIELIMDIKQDVGTENQENITTINNNFTSIEQNLTFILIECVKQYNTDKIYEVDKIVKNLLNNIELKKYFCTNNMQATLSLFKKYLLNVIEKQVEHFSFRERIENIFNLKETISNTTIQTHDKDNFNLDRNWLSCANEISRKIVDLIRNSVILFPHIALSKNKIESSIQTSDIYQLYVNLFENFETDNIPFNYNNILDIQSVILNTLQDKLHKIKRNQTVKSKTISAIGLVINQHFGIRNSRINAVCAIVTQEQFFEKYEKKLYNMIHDILMEYKSSTKIKENFQIILDRIYNASDYILNNNHILENSSNNCHVNWDTVIQEKLRFLKDLNNKSLRQLETTILEEVLQKCPNLTSVVFNKISREISCTLLKYRNINRTMLIVEISYDVANDIKNILDDKEIYNLNDFQSDKCLSYHYNFNLSIFNDTVNDKKYLSIDHNELYGNISHLLSGKKNETNSYILQKIPTILNNIPDTVRETISNITFESLEKYKILNSERKRSSFAIEISRKIVDLIENSKIPVTTSLSHITLSQPKIESSIQTSDIYQLYVNLFENFETYNIPFNYNNILDIQSVIINTLQNKLPKIKRNQAVKSKIYGAIGFVITPHFGIKNSRINAICAIGLTKQVVGIISPQTNYQRFEINDIREFNLVKLQSYEMETVTTFLFNFIAVTQEQFFEKYEKKLYNMIHDILMEYKSSTKIKENFQIILDKIYNASDYILSNNYILGTLEPYLNEIVTGNTSSLLMSNSIMRNNIMKNLPLNFQEIKIFLLESAIFHVLLEHNFDCNNFNRTNLINDIINQVELILDTKQDLGTEYQEEINTMNINFTSIVQYLTFFLIECQKGYYNGRPYSMDVITQNVIDIITLEKFICPNNKRATFSLFKQYFSNVLKTEVNQHFFSEQMENIFNLEETITKLFLLEYSKCVYEKGYNLNIQNRFKHINADWRCLIKYTHQKK
ncbi:uncharacterized protein LOC127286436 isoform X2 [Leptopilina boulardi]|uniref:uncharacterized protein LOC127286436 isoform X2 n=1 Tax=Leptopilina boulardi TaxID=63433 RepID=UPI0021F677E6|nr:uncharacterized protein LOC127286436 isoform X2 [Leptopilina boulardi]